MDELLEGDVALAFSAQVDHQLVGALCLDLVSESGEGGFEVWMGRGVPLGLMEPQCSLSNMSKISLISRMS